MKKLLMAFLLLLTIAGQALAEFKGKWIASRMDEIIKTAEEVKEAAEEAEASA